MLQHVAPVHLTEMHQCCRYITPPKSPTPNPSSKRSRPSAGKGAPLGLAASTSALASSNCRTRPLRPSAAAAILRSASHGKDSLKVEGILWVRCRKYLESESFSELLIASDSYMYTLPERIMGPTWMAWNQNRPEQVTILQLFKHVQQIRDHPIPFGSQDNYRRKRNKQRFNSISYVVET